MESNTARKFVYKKHTCIECKRVFEDCQGTKVPVCIWYGDKGLPPFVRASGNDPTTMYADENMPILAHVWYCIDCL